MNPGRRRLIVVAAAVVALGVTAAVAVQVGRETPVACPPTADVCVVEHRFVTGVDPSGQPQAEVRSRAAGDPLVVWMALEGEPSSALYRFAWTHDGETLLASPVRLPQSLVVHLTLSGRFTTDPGRYRFVLTDPDGRELLETSIPVRRR